MTPRVVRTVEELEGLPEGATLVDAGGDITVVAYNSDGERRYVSVFAGSTADVMLVDLPARLLGDNVALWEGSTVLAPLSVTAEQVEAGALTLIRADYSRTGRDPNTVTHSIWENREDITAALAAMGIPVVEHV